MAKTVTAEQTIEQELLEATGEKPQAPKEVREKYLARLVRATTDDSKVDEEGWKGLSKGAQEWVTDAADALNKKKGITDFETSEEEPAAEEDEVTEAAADEPAEEEAEEADAADEEGEEEEVEAKAPIKAASKKKVAVAATDEAPKQPKAPGATKRVRQMICENADWDRKQLDEAIENEGLSIGKTTRNIVYYDTHATMTLLKELGWKAPK